MPLVEGESLRSRLDHEGELPVPEAARLFREVADALAYAHREGVMHRDIKPDNILLSHRHAMVTDFGVARAVSEAVGGTTLTRTGMAVGTPAYMAPEQAAAAHTDHRADIYALGLVAFEMLAGYPPFSGTTPQALGRKLPRSARTQLLLQRRKRSHCVGCTRSRRHEEIRRRRRRAKTTSMRPDSGLILPKRKSRSWRRKFRR